MNTKRPCILLGILIAIALPPARAATVAPLRVLTTGTLVLVHKGSVISRLANVSGGDIAASVAVNKQAGTSDQLAISETPVAKPLILEFPQDGVPPAAQQALNDLLQLKQPSSPDSVWAVILLDGDGRPVERIRIQNALVADLELPGCDGELSTDPVRVVLSGDFERSSVTGGDRMDIPPVGPPLKKIRLNVAGISAGAVQTMSGLSFATGIVTDAAGEARETSAGGLEDRLVTMNVGLAQSGALGDVAAPWQAWIDPLRKGVHITGRQAGIDYLDDAGNVAMSVDLGDVKIARVDEDFRPLAARKTRITLVGTSASVHFGAVTASAVPASATQGPVFGQLYPTRNGPSVSVESAEWSIRRCSFKIGEEPQVVTPEARQKMLVLRLKLRNPTNAPMSVDFNTLQTRLTDTDGKLADGVGRLFDEQDFRSVATDLAAEAELSTSTFIVVPGRSVGKTLTIGTDQDHPEIAYDLSDTHNTITKLAPPFVAANDSTGSIALEQVVAHKNTVCPLGSFDATFLGASRSTASFADMPDGPKWIASIRICNRTLGTAHLDFSSLQVILAQSAVDAGKETRPFPSDATDAPFSVDIKPGAEVAVRYPFTMPTSENPSRLMLSEGSSRVYVIEGEDLKTK